MADDAKGILQAVRADDVAAFDAAVGKHKNLYIGRFSLLAVCYLYGSRRIVGAYAQAMRQGNPLRLDEDRQVYNDFAKVAGKALRLWAGYSTADVEPLEMLALTGDWRVLRREFARGGVSAEEGERVVLIIKLRYGVRAAVRDGQLVLPPKPLKRSTEGLLTALLAALVVVFLAGVAALALGLVYREGVPVGSLADLQTVSADKQYVLKRDLALDDTVDWSHLHLNGAGHTLTIDVSATPHTDVFDGAIENCTVRIVGHDVTVTQSYATFARVNAGSFRDVTFSLESAEGWTVTLADFARNEEGLAESCAFGGLFVENKGEICGCTLRGDLNWVGMGEVDGELGGFASTNTGLIESCTLEGNVRAETVDLGGFVFRNEKGGVLCDCIQKEGYVVAQTTSVYQWSPKTGGVCAVNYGVVENARVYGDVECAKADVSFPDGEKILVSYVHAGGVCANNYGVLTHCLTTGGVYGRGDYTAVYAGGIAADNYYDKETSDQPAVLRQCIAAGTVRATGYYINLGGLTGATSGYLEADCFNGKLEYDASRAAAVYVGTVSGYGRFEDADVPELFKDDHVCRLYYQTLFGYNAVPVIGYYEQAASAIATLVGVTDHDSLEFGTLEAYWYGKESE